MWLNSGNSGTQWEWPFSTTVHNTWVFVGSGPNDKASSYYNNRTDASRIGRNFPVVNDDEAQQCVAPQAVVTNLTSHTWFGGSSTQNDSISSIELTTATSC